MNVFIKFYNELMELLYPKKCMCCDNIENTDICERCLERLERISSNKRCMACGMEQKFCDCHRMVFQFESDVAPFYNAGLAQLGFYRFKFLKCEFYGEFFAKEMLNCIKNEYKNIRFDAVCYIPTTNKNIIKRGYDQSEVLAEYISEKLNLPLFNCIKLKRKFKVKTQHKLDYKQRMAAVKDKYYVNMRFNNKNVLLIDDIKTSGSSLDEAARQLLYAGVNKVYCATALVTARNYEIKDPYSVMIYNSQKNTVENNSYLKYN